MLAAYESLVGVLRTLVEAKRGSDITIYRADVPDYWVSGANLRIGHKGNFFLKDEKRVPFDNPNLFFTYRGQMITPFGDRYRVEMPFGIKDNIQLTKLHLDLTDASIFGPIYLKPQFNGYVSAISLFSEADAVLAAGMLTLVQETI